MIHRFVAYTLLPLALCTSPHRLAAQQGEKPSLERTRLRLTLAIEQALEDDLLAPELAPNAYDHIEYLLQQPRDINRITADELAEYRLLSPYQIYQFVHYRTERGGHIASLYDLKDITGWSEDLVLDLAPLLYTTSPEAEGSPPSRHSLESAKASLLYSHGIGSARDRDFVGSNTSLALRGQYISRGRLSIFAGAERDRGEPWSYAGRVGFDSYTGHFALESRGILRRLIVGDYRATWGEGLVLAQGFALRPPYTPRIKPTGLRPTYSLGEGERSRGVALSLGHHRWQAELLYSRQRLDGSIDTDGSIRALSDIGLHRTERELERRHTTPMTHWGGRIGYEGDRLTLGLHFLQMSFAPNRLAHPPGASRSEALHSLETQTTLALNARWSSRTGRTRLATELARTAHGGWAIVALGHWLLPRWGEVTLGMRHISPNYWSYYGRSWTHSLRPHDEQGLSLHTTTRELIGKTKIEAGVDLYRRVSDHAMGYSLRTTLELARAQGGYLRGSLSLNKGLERSSTLRIGLQRCWRLGRLSLTPSVALSHSAQGWGYLLALRGGADWGTKLKLWGSVGRYDSPWSGRLYMGEHRLLYEYGFTMLYGRGTYLSAGGMWHIGGRCHLGLRGVYNASDSAQPSALNALSLGLYIK